MINIAQVQAGDRNTNQLQENIRRALEAQFIDEVGSFTANATGLTKSVNAIGYWQTGTTQNAVTLYIPQMQGTSSSTSLSFSGLPTNIFPKRTQRCLCVVVDSGTPSLGFAYINTNGTVSFDSDISGGVFTASGTKGTVLQSVTYIRGI